MIIRDTRFDNNGVARLGEDPGGGEDRAQSLELQRHVVTRLKDPPPNNTHFTYSLTIYVDFASGRGEDLTFHGISRGGLKLLGEELVRLSCAE